MSDPIDNSGDIFLPQSDRLQIFPSVEYELLWRLPRFSQYDRDLFITMAMQERHALARIRTLRTKASLACCMLGYLGARHEKAGFCEYEEQSESTRISSTSAAEYSGQKDVPACSSAHRPLYLVFGAAADLAVCERLEISIDLHQITSRITAAADRDPVVF